MQTYDGAQVSFRSLNLKPNRVRKHAFILSLKLILYLECNMMNIYEYIYIIIMSGSR